MAKDGSNRGGNRIGAGRKGKSRKEKILDGTAHFTEKNGVKISKSKIKPPKKFLTADQKDGSKLYSKKVYKEAS